MDFDKWFEEIRKDKNIFVIFSIRGLLSLAFEAGYNFALEEIKKRDIEKSLEWKEKNVFIKEQIAPVGELEIPEDFDVDTIKKEVE